MTHPLAKYKFTQMHTLHEWEPIPQPFIHYEKVNNEFGDVPTASISLRKADLAMCINTNGYLSWWGDRGILPEETHKSWFYSELIRECNEEVRANPRSKKFDLDNGIVIPLSTVYSGWNQGHDLSVIVYTHIAYLKTIEKFPEKNVFIAVNSYSLANARNTAHLINYLFPTDKIILVNPGVVYEFPNYVTPPTNYFNLNGSIRHKQHQHIEQNNDEPLVTQTLDYLVTCVKTNPIHRAKLHGIIDECGGKFILAKTAAHKAARKEGIVPDFVLESLSKRGKWYVINPESLSLMEIIFLLSHATEVIMGSGGIQYTHKYFVNRDAQIYTLFFSSHTYPAYHGQKEVNIGMDEVKTTKHIWKQFVKATLEGNLL